MAADLTRRILFGTASAAGLGLAAARAAEPPELRGAAGGGPANPDPAPRRLGVALVGIGQLTKEELLPAFGEAKHVRLAALVSGDRDKARTIAAAHNVPEKNIYDYRSFDALRDNAEVDIVYVVLPNAMHAEYTARAAKAGKHVLCEKPMATSVADAQAMIDACRGAGRKLMIAYRCQYEPCNRAAAALARSGEFGAVRLIEAVNGQNQPGRGEWRLNKSMAGGGSLPDVGIYCLNAARFLTGEEPVEVSARTTQPKGDPRFREVEDVAAFTLGFPSGVQAVCASGYSFADSRRYRVMAERGWFELDPAFSYEGLRLRIGRRDGGAEVSEERRFGERNQFALEMDHFADAIRDNFVPRTPGEEGLQDQRLMEAIYQAASGGGVLRLPEVAGRDTTRGQLPG